MSSFDRLRCHDYCILGRVRSYSRATRCLGIAPLGIALTLSGCGADSDTVNGPDDFVAVVESALYSAEERLPRVSDCLTGFTVEPAWHLDDRAVYVDGIISVRVPATAPRIEQSVIHELAHHLDATCPSVDEVRPLFQAAQQTDAAWDRGPTWAETPAEQFAEAVTLVVLDRQRAGNVVIRADAVDVISEWAGSPPSRQVD